MQTGGAATMRACAVSPRSAGEEGRNKARSEIGMLLRHYVRQRTALQSRYVGQQLQPSSTPLRSAEIVDRRLTDMGRLDPEWDASRDNLQESMRTYQIDQRLSAITEIAAACQSISQSIQFLLILLLLVLFSRRSFYHASAYWRAILIY